MGLESIPRIILDLALSQTELHRYTVVVTHTVSILQDVDFTHDILLLDSNTKFKIEHVDSLKNVLLHWYEVASTSKN